MSIHLITYFKLLLVQIKWASYFLKLRIYFKPLSEYNNTFLYTMENSYILKNL